MRSAENNSEALAVVYWPIGNLIAYTNNARLHSSEQIAEIAASIKEFGFTNPCLVDEAGVLIAGHGRLLAAQQIGMAEVPVIKLGHLTDQQVKALRLADNRIALSGTWSEDLLRSELLSLNVGGFDVRVVGFDLPELHGLGLTLDNYQPPAASVKLSDRFGVVPFSVLNAREGWWQARKQAWLALGIQSEVGRGENLLKMSDTVLQPDPKKRAAAKAAARSIHDGTVLRAGRGGLADQLGKSLSEKNKNAKAR